MNEKEFLLYIIKALVDEPDEVEINVVEGEKSTIFELKVAQPDIGKVIGKSGRIAKAIRTILNAAIARSGKRISLDILG
ncbi:MAG TPA: KH domain-containing protein [Spirochaetota bacterium]|jgi:predicted RNA-binding protein YlqC (UPF0109 family)|nr:KH domain-containing protein [Spirochaetota bacterium]